MKKNKLLYILLTVNTSAILSGSVFIASLIKNNHIVANNATNVLNVNDCERLFNLFTIANKSYKQNELNILNDHENIQSKIDLINDYNILKNHNVQNIVYFIPKNTNNIYIAIELKTPLKVVQNNYFVLYEKQLISKIPIKVSIAPVVGNTELAYQCIKQYVDKYQTFEQLNGLENLSSLIDEMNSIFSIKNINVVNVEFNQLRNNTMLQVIMVFNNRIDLLANSFFVSFDNDFAIKLINPFNKIIYKNIDYLVNVNMDNFYKRLNELQINKNNVADYFATLGNVLTFFNQIPVISQRIFNTEYWKILNYKFINKQDNSYNLILQFKSYQYIQINFSFN